MESSPAIFADIRLFPLVSHPFANGVPTVGMLRIPDRLEDGQGSVRSPESAPLLGKQVQRIVARCQ